MSGQIKELLQTKDNSEKIRDQIAAILKMELLKQATLADESPIENKGDFDISVYLENARPWELTSDNQEENPFPLVNVCLAEIGEDQAKPGATVGKNKYTGIYYVDCYGCGNNQPEGSEEYISDDSLSALRAWQTARIVRNILMSGFYAYLGMQGDVMRRKITKITTIMPPIAESALSVTACRIVLEVDFFEIAPEGDGVNFEGISFVSKNDGEVTLINI